MVETLPAPVRVSVVSGSALSDGAYAVFDIRAPAGAVIPPHVRAHQDAVLLVVTGELQVACGDTRQTLGRGDTAALPRDVACRVDARTDVHLLCLAMPAGLEDLADLVADQSLELDDIAALLAAAGITLLPRAWARRED